MDGRSKPVRFWLTPDKPARGLQSIIGAFFAKENRNGSQIELQSTPPIGGCFRWSLLLQLASRRRKRLPDSSSGSTWA